MRTDIIFERIKTRKPCVERWSKTKDTKGQRKKGKRRDKLRSDL